MTTQDPAANIAAVVTPLAAATSQRAVILGQLDAADLLATLDPAQPDFSSALEVAYTSDKKVLLGTGAVSFDARLAGAAGAAHILLGADDTDTTALQLTAGQLVADGRAPAGVALLNDAAHVGSRDTLAAAGEKIVWVTLADVAAVARREPVICPELFERNLIAQARAAEAHIVLPEGDDDRILQAADQILRDKICRLTILGDPEAMRARAEELGLDISAANLADPTTGETLEEFAQDFAELRKHKGISLDEARETMTDISYYATMMIHKGLADGMVSGAAHTTAHTIKPSFQIIRTAPGSSVVSSIFLMVMEGTLWAFGDCAVNPNPSPDELAEIAAVSAKTAAQFGIEPRVAMLSYSTGSSGTGEDVEAVAAAVRTAQDNNPELQVDGPLQFDAAVVESVGAKKMPGSDVAGRATVFVFPDLNSGNIAYKAVQRTAGALAVGPILQGLNKPVNDLSRGATVADIVNTVAITAIQAH